MKQEMLGHMDRGAFGLCLDVNHMMGAHRELPRIVEGLGGDLVNLHLSDYDGVDEKHWMPGEGVIDWKGFVAALRRIGYAGPYNYECKLYGDTAAERVAGFERNFDELMRKL